VIYLDSSVVLAQVLMEDRRPYEQLWRSPLTSSRLLEYEVFNRVHIRRLEQAQLELVHRFLEAVEFIEMSRQVLVRALEPWPISIRTLDALHLATMDFLRKNGESVELASYDSRLVAAAQALGIAPAEL
jgi:predicted nucleic acid-binding protein